MLVLGLSLALAARIEHHAVEAPDEAEIMEDPFPHEPMEAEAPANMTIEVLYVRHGHGCHNALSYQGEKVGFFNLGKPKQASYLDPPLTNCGVQQSSANGEQLREALREKGWEAEYYFTSTLARTVETAAFMFPDERLYPIPFIAEKGVGMIKGGVNSPRDLQLQKELFANRSWDVNWTFLPTEHITLKDPRLKEGPLSQRSWRHWGADAARRASSHQAFQAYFGERVLPELLAERGPSTSLRLAIFGHGKWMKSTMHKYFGCRELPKFKNNRAVFVKYAYEVAERRLTPITGENACAQPFEGPTAMYWNQDYLCPKDYRRCFDHGGSAYMADWDGDFDSELIEDEDDDNLQGCCGDNDFEARPAGWYATR